jgi:hypothetical protein
MIQCKRTPAGREMDGAWLSQIIAASSVKVIQVEGFTSIKPAPPRREAIDPGTKLHRKDVLWRKRRDEQKAKLTMMIQSLEESAAVIAP